MSLRELKSLWNDIEERSSTNSSIEPARYGLRRTKARSNDDGTVFANQDIFRETPALYDLRRIVSTSSDDSPGDNPSAINTGPNKAQSLSSQKRKKELEEDAKFAKRIKDSSASIAKAYTCPLTGVLLYNPVMIEGDGSILYERKAIAEYMDKHTSSKENFVLSPVSDKIIGTTIIPAYQARDAIFHLVESGILDGCLTDVWRDHMATKKESDDGNPRAMVDLAYLLTDPDGDGTHCPSPDEEKKAYALWKHAADLGNLEGMCEAGECLVEGTGVDRDEGVGIKLIEKAATAGHANACLSMALDHSMGLNGLDKSSELTKQWARKALDTNKPWSLDESERKVAEKLLLIEDVEKGGQVEEGGGEK